MWVSVFYSCLKHLSWEYEKELRVVVANKSRYLDAIPSAIYIGAKCSAKNEEQLFEISKNLNIPTYKMHFDEYSSSFELSVRSINDK